MELMQLTQTEKSSFDIKTIALKVREQLKSEFPNCVFSVRIERYSMGQSLHIGLMKSDRKIKMDFKDVSGLARFRYAQGNRTEKILEEMQNENYHQLNTHFGKYDKDCWCNGVFLTESGFNLLKGVVDIVNQYNWDNSDIQTDYFDVHFHLSLNLGQYEKPFEDGKL